MFEVGFLEIVVVGIVALLVLGPERLPHAARMTGAFIGRMTRAFSNIREEIEREVNLHEMQQRIKKQWEEGALGELKRDMETTEADIRRNLQGPDALPYATRPEDAGLQHHEAGTLNNTIADAPMAESAATKAVTSPANDSSAPHKDTGQRDA